MTPTDTIDGAVSRYLEAVRAQLSDLPEAEREDLLEDLAQHLHEVSAEEGADLEARLGPPEDYAHELLVSSGLERRDHHPGRRSDRWRATLRRFREQVTDDPRVQEVLEAAKRGRPVWWLARGYLLVLLGGVFVGGAVAMATWPFPRLWASRLAGLIVTLLVIPASYAVGRRADRGGWWRRANLVVNGLLVFYVFASGSRITWAAQAVWWPPQVVVEAEEGLGHGQLRGPLGDITNIYPYDGDGRPLDGVLLYDQYGNPVEIVVGHTPDGLPIVTSYPLDVDGEPVTNAFPQHQSVRGDHDPIGPMRHDGVRRPDVDPRELQGGSSSAEEDDAMSEASPSPGPSPSNGAAALTSP